MDVLVETVMKCVPFAAWLQKAGMSAEWSAALSIVIVLGLGWWIGHFAKTQFKKWQNLAAAKDLKPQFDYQTVKDKTRIYIPTQYQNASPTRQEEPGFTHQYVSTSPLIPFFLEKAFNERVEGERFYLILADSGMGKTTFMINLYLRYHAFFNRRRKFAMRLFKFSEKDTLTEIKAIPKTEAKNTILLLDALDEDPFIVSSDPNLTDAQAFQHRVDEIIEATRYFCEVVMTCRTQYFPGQEDNPYELNVKRPDEKGFYVLNKLYISPFTAAEVHQYLKKKYGWLPFWNRKKKLRAAQLVNQSRHLVMRPMMLSYIDDLLSDVGKKFETDYEIYETLIEKWLAREADKRKKKVEQPVFMDALHRVSQQTAIAIWQAWQANKRLYLTKAEAVAISAQNGIDLKPEEVTGQSLLTCDGAGNWKFAHKSIMEFFLAKHVAENFSECKAFNFTGMDMARRFCQDLGVLDLVFLKGGTFLMGSPESETGRTKDETQHPVTVSDFYLSVFAVTVMQFEAFIEATGYQTDADKDGGSYFWSNKKWVKKTGTNWRSDVKGGVQVNKKHPVIHISWNDANAYCQWLSEKYGGVFRLPTEAEWEFACRAGTQTPFNTGSNLTTEQANYDGNFPYEKNPKGKYLAKTAPVGSYPANAWGLHEMHGNVVEWCQDWYGEKYYDECKANGTVVNPAGASSGEYRVIRGGSWSSVAPRCRSALRIRRPPAAHRSHHLGFRLVFVPQ